MIKCGVCFKNVLIAINLLIDRKTGGFFIDSLEHSSDLYYYKYVGGIRTYFQW